MRKAFGILALIFLMSGCSHAAGKPRQFTYAYSWTQEPSEEFDKYIVESLEHGYKIFNYMTDKRMGSGTFVRTTDVEKATVVVYIDYNTPVIAVTPIPKGLLGHGQIRLFWVNLQHYSKINLSRVVCHEFAHLSLQLYDHHGNSNYTTTDRRPECVMDDFFGNGWTGKFCTECQNTTDRIFDGLGHRPRTSP